MGYLQGIQDYRGIPDYQSIQEERESKNRVTKRVAQFLVPALFVGLAGNVHEELDGSRSVSGLVTGHWGGETQVREACERWSNSRSAVGLAEVDLLQHNLKSFQSSSERPRDSAARGFCSFLPDVTVHINWQ